MSRIAYTGARIFDGEFWHDRSALVVTDGKVEGIIAADSPTDAQRVSMGGGILAPGFIDLQINGAGGAQVNLDPSVAAIETICATAARYGTTSCLPTFITDTSEQTARATAAGAAASSRGVPGFLGLHLEGPHLSIARKGAHDPALIRPMEEKDLLMLVEARTSLPQLLVTVAPEAVTPNQITRLTEAGIVVSLGHSNAGYADVRAAVEAGARMVTHLFNAQSQLGNREPGVVGAALDFGLVSAGLIADGIHVDAVSIGVALRAKRGPGHIFLVTDGMSVMGTDAQSFELTGRMVHRKDGALRLADGTLAGADLTMIDAVAYVHRALGVDLDEALRMASLYPARAMGLDRSGRIAVGSGADIVHLGDDLSIRGVLIAGVPSAV
ncbi:MAG TPA: N-acetylglucosamine-6-phosphate deacetylase [Devosia sp.]|nr:N-acetylglucosamine-6-phosphate deacetylase [Devosia sp.]